MSSSRTLLMSLWFANPFRQKEELMTSSKLVNGLKPSGLLKYFIAKFICMRLLSVESLLA
jgi:ABC-type uncharacterized transport system permease subunit